MHPLSGKLFDIRDPTPFFKAAKEKYCAIEISGENEDDIDIPWSFLYTISVKKTFVYEIVKVSDCRLDPDVPNGEEKTGYCIDVHLWIGRAEQRDEEADLMFYYDPNILRIVSIEIISV